MRRGGRSEHRHERTLLGQPIRELRKQRGLAQERLGKRAGLSGRFSGEVERGEQSISIDSRYRVSAALEVPLGHLPAAPELGFETAAPVYMAST